MKKLFKLSIRLSISIFVVFYFGYISISTIGIGGIIFLIPFAIFFIEFILLKVICNEKSNLVYGLKINILSYMINNIFGIAYIIMANIHFEKRTKLADVDYNSLLILTLILFIIQIVSWIGIYFTVRLLK